MAQRKIYVELTIDDPNGEFDKHEFATSLPTKVCGFDILDSTVWDNADDLNSDFQEGVGVFSKDGGDD